MVGHGPWGADTPPWEHPKEKLIHAKRALQQVQDAYSMDLFVHDPCVSRMEAAGPGTS